MSNKKKPSLSTREILYQAASGGAFGNEVDPLTWLQGWYTTQCDGDWEHTYGIKLETLDNPGWLLKVDLAETPWTDFELLPTQLNRAEHDWLHVKAVEHVFEAACGPLNLGEAIGVFRRWVRKEKDFLTGSGWSEYSAKPIEKQ